MPRFHVRSKGIGLRTYLTGLVLVPLLVCLALAGASVAERVGEATAASAVADRVEVAADLQTLESDLQSELIPSLAYSIVSSPLLRQVIHLGSLKPSDIGLSAALVKSLRARTDADVRRLAGTSDAALARSAREQIAAARNNIDAGIGLAAGFNQVLALSGKLAGEARSQLGRAVAADASPTLTRAVRDSNLVSSALAGSASEVAYLTAYKFPGLGTPGASPAQARGLWLDTWGAAVSSSGAVARQAGADTARRWRSALADPTIARFETQLAAYAADPSRPLDVAGVAAMYQANNARAAAMKSVGTWASARASRLAGDASSASARSAVLIGGLVLLALLASLAVAVAIRRAIARPLQQLATQAETVSQGELIDVTAAGPREVRTVATGLSAAVDNLRKIEAQAAAVAAGELDSEIVREPLPGPLGAVMHDSVATIIDAIHQRDVAQSDLAYQATHDSLTGLPNRTQAMLSIGHALQRARRTGELTALIFVDLDFFKVVNDTLGHAAGDEVLRRSAQRMAALLRDSDVVFRLGGDEFVVLLEDISRDFPFVSLAERLISALSEPVTVGRNTAKISASVGISLCQDASLDAERLLGEADAAAYSAKNAGRGRVGVYDQALRDTLTHRAATEAALQQALDNREFVLHYQPVVEMGSARPIGFEALIRWNHPLHGMTPPGEFIPIAEKSALINGIGRWTLHEALAQLARWDAEGSHSPDLTMAVNVSGRHLVAADLMVDVQSALAESGIDAGRLIIEVTETVLVDDPIALHNMQQLRDLGVAVAIDDFGTGFTSIGQIPKLPIDVLKIDRSFTSSEQPGHRELVRLIVEAAHAFGLSVVAEGIEGAEQASSLRRLAVDTGQGFFYGHPAPALHAARMADHESLPMLGDTRLTETDDAA